jgi:GxxExxY protein
MQQPQNIIARKVIGLAMKVHRVLGFGFTETVYRNALAVELRRVEVSFECHPMLSVMYEGAEVGIFQADLIVGRELIVELKAVDALSPAHSAQLVNYLAATKIDNGLLLNFGNRSLEFKTKTRMYSAADEPVNLQS